MLSFKPTCDPQVGSNKIFHFFLRWTVDDAFFFFFSSTGARSEEGLPQLFSPLLYSFALWEPDPFHLHVLLSPSE